MGTGIVRSLAAATLGLITASCSQTDTAKCEAQQPFVDQNPATYGAASALGGPTHQWSLLVTVNALDSRYMTWYNQNCSDDVRESTRRQELFAQRLGFTLAEILLRNRHCVVSTIAVLAYGNNGCGRDAMSNPSGVYVIFSCPNGEPLVTATQQ